MCFVVLAQVVKKNIERHGRIVITCMYDVYLLLEWQFAVFSWNVDHLLVGHGQVQENGLKRLRQGCYRKITKVWAQCDIPLFKFPDKIDYFIVD